MYSAELLAELRTRNALIVHCSRTGKANEAIGGLFYPDDLRRAISICDGGTELCCSVIWPDHLETFGAVGIVLKPRSTASVTSIWHQDSGTRFDATSQKREGLGVPYDRQAVLNTFVKPTGYNEWNVRDADTIGIFVHPTEPLDVSRPCKLSSLPGYAPTTGEEAIAEETVIGPFTITPANVATDFPKLPIYSFRQGMIVRIKPDDRGLQFVAVDPAELYR